AARGLARAAMRMDAPAQRDILEMTLSDLGVVEAWDQVILPVLIGIGERYESTRRFVEVEHLISRSVTEALAAVPRPPSDQIPRVLLAAADEEQHTLPLEALAAALAEIGVPCRLLGARVPPQALGDAMARTGPAAVVVWSSTARTADPEQVRRLVAGPHPPLLVAAAGPGWAQRDLPPGVPQLTSLTEAVRIVSAAAADAPAAG
ncbi:MAG TPA: B12-binding domain-containing protein, partial [Pseudonocardiaceae bacterium]|nr:B12-binding domain-containing protein [Pseudonocardiaceae bacterium]